MISYLKGKVVLFRWGLIILDVNGVGYKVCVNPQINIKNNIIDTKEDVELFVYENIREDTDDLYGFLTYQELELFEKLISVNGVGPKAGINIMSSGKPEAIISAILSDNLGFFTAVSGIGKKAAAKIILELKSKIGGGTDIELGQFDQSNDVIDALEALGYKKQELTTILSKIPKEIVATEDKIRWCLKNLGK
jgi:Holliday junction DNA helicase RuvA